MKTVVAFGNFDLEGARSWVIRTGLTAHNVNVSLCRTDAPGFFGKCRDLLRQWKTIGHADAIYVVFLGHYFVPLAWWLARKKKIPVIFDAFLSLHDTEVADRKRVSAFSPRAWFLWFIDWLACKLSDVILLDTEEHKEFFTRKFGIASEKIIVLPVGCRTDLFVATHDRHDKGFTVEFHGTYIPLQGIDVIVEAAKMLPDITFSLIGKGQMHGAIQSKVEHMRLQNIRFTGFVPIAELPRYMHEADVCLGIFGTTPKADRVIPNKAYEAIACGKPLITADTSASRRVFSHQKNVVLVRPGNANALADGILALKNDAQLRKNIGAGGRSLSEKSFQPHQIVMPLVSWLTTRATT